MHTLLKKKKSLRAFQSFANNRYKNYITKDAHAFIFIKKNLYTEEKFIFYFLLHFEIKSGVFKNSFFYDLDRLETI